MGSRTDPERFDARTQCARPLDFTVISGLDFSVDVRPDHNAQIRRADC